MEIEIPVNTLKNILTALTATHSEVNIVLSSDPIRLQFVSSKYECILYWSLTDILTNKKTDNFYRSESVQIDKLLSRLITNGSSVSLAMSPEDETVLVFKQCVEINNLITSKTRPLEGLYYVFSLKIPFVEKHQEITDYIIDYVQYKHEFCNPALGSAIFDIKTIEKMINTSLNYTTSVEFNIKDGMMEFSTKQGDSLSVSSKLLQNDTKVKISKKIEISHLSFIKAYRKTSQWISVSYLTSPNRQSLLVKPITQGSPLNTELVIFFN